MSKRKVANPLALAALSCLFERPMHPYEMATTMRERHKDDSIRLNYGSLYTVIQSLERHRMIVPQEVQRDGNRPERTVFAITDAGRLELIDWLSELICVPAHDYTQFEAGLSLLAILPPGEASRLLRERCQRIEFELAQGVAARDFAVKRQLPRIFWIEGELRWALRKAELEFVEALVAEIEGGTLDGMAQWRGFHGETGVVLKIPDATPRKSRE